MLSLPGTRVASTPPCARVAHSRSSVLVFARKEFGSSSTSKTARSSNPPLAGHRTSVVLVFAQKGFGSSSTSGSKTKSRTSNPLEGGRGALRQNLADKQNVVLKKNSGANLVGTFDEGSSAWIDIGMSTGAFDAKGKDVVAKVLPSKEVVCVYRAPGNGSYFCSDANSTAFQYPLIDAKVELDKETGEVTAEVPFDGTIYVLNSKPVPGAVKLWCPQNTVGRRVLGAMKSKEDPKPLKMYPVRVVEGGKIQVKFSG